MKKWLSWILEIVLAAFIFTCGGQAPKLFATTLSVAMTFTYSSTGAIDSNNLWPACTTTITTDCITGFNVYDVTNPATPSLLGKVPNASPASGATQPSSTFTLNNPVVGTHTAVARTAYIGAGGSAAESVDSAPASFQITASPPAAPASLTIKVAP